jgi:ribosomal protein S27AE
VPLRQKIDCPQCGAPLVRKPGGRCPSCGTAVAAHVERVRTREERIERIVAVVGTVLVVAVFSMTAGLGLVEGVLAYAGAGAAMFYLAKRTFG